MNRKKRLTFEIHRDIRKRQLLSLQGTKRSFLLRYFIAVLLTLLALGGRVLLIPIIGYSTPFILFFPAIMAASWYGGVGPGIIATVIGAAASNYYFHSVTPGFNFGVMSNNVQLIIYIIIGLMISILNELLHRSRARIVETALQVQKVQEEIQKSNEKNTSILESVNDGLLLFDANWRFTYINAKAAEYMPQPRETLIGKNVWKVFGYSKNTLAYKKYHQAIKTGKSIVFEEYYPQVKQWLEFRAFPSKEGMIVYFTDITKSKQLEEKSKQQEQRFEGIIRNVPGVVWEALGNPKDKNQQINYVSDYVETMLGYTVKDWISTPNFWLSIVHPDDKEKATQEATHKYKSGIAGKNIFRWIKKSGEVIWVETHSKMIADKNGKPIGMQGVTLDITDRIIAERRKDEFISIASHELKTPVTSIKIFTQVLQRLFLKEKNFIVSDYLGKMDSQIDKLSKLITDLLDISKIQTGKLQLNPEQFNIKHLILEVIDTIQPTAPQHKIEINGEVKHSVFADKNRIEQVIINLITNAIKYSPKSKRVDILLEEDDMYMSVSVRDYGIGIDKAHHSKIFDRFYRVNDEEKTFSGLGIGLYISHDIIQRHRGKFSIASKENEGSTFTFTLPLKNNS